MRGSVSQYQDMWETPAGLGCTGLLCSAIKTCIAGGSFVRQELLVATCLKCHKCQSLLDSERCSEMDVNGPSRKKKKMTLILPVLPENHENENLARLRHPTNQVASDIVGLSLA